MTKIILSIIAGLSMILISTVIEITPSSLEFAESAGEKSISESGVVETVTPNQLKSLKSSVDIARELKNIYDSNSEYDIAGVLYIEDFVFNIVMNPTEDDHYLNKSRDGRDDFKGELFLSDNSKFNEDDKSLDMTRIYGHAMLSGERFGMLNRLTSPANKRDMYFYDGNKTTRYEMAKGMEFVDGSTYIERYDLNGDKKQEFLDELTSSAKVSHVDNIDISKETVFLQTCAEARGLDRYLIAFTAEEVIE